MPERDRLKLLKLLSKSTTPLWLTERPWSEDLTEMSRAADWLTSLGHAARNGFSVHYRELDEVEMFQPTLVCYDSFIYSLDINVLIRYDMMYSQYNVCDI